MSRRSAAHASDDSAPPDRRRRRVGPLLPRNEGERALVFVVAVLCALSCVCAEGASAVARAAHGWTRDLSAAATVQVRARAGETASEAAGRGAEALAGVRGVSEARALDRKAAADLLTPWFGRDGVPDDLPIPQLVTVELDPHAPASLAALEAALTHAGVDAVVDDHARWLTDVRRSALGAAGVAAAAAAAVAAAAGAVIAFATRAQLAARRDVVEILHLIGAADRFVARLFVRRFAGLAARAGLWGALVAAGVGAVAREFGGSDGFSPLLPVDWRDVLLVLPCPVIAAAVAAFAARRTALAILRSRP